MNKGVKKKTTALVMCSSMLASVFAGCAGSEEKKSQEATKPKEETTTVDSQKQEDEVVTLKKLGITIDESITYQTMESFGASGAWWSQDVGGWTDTNEDGVELRDEIATLLFDKEKGIGLTAYRYNIGAGSAESENSKYTITDWWRRAQSFETAPGVYDWTKDENAVWMMDKALELGVTELVFFCNSPLERLTNSGKAHADENAENKSNLPEENYREFAEYVMDVVEHFIDEGYPIKYVSPINEPQWDWTGGQEGCHYEPEEVVKFLNVFLDVMEERNIEGLELSAPELGEWGNTSYKYLTAIFQDERLSSAITTLDMHSYWTNTSTKTEFMEWLEKMGKQDLELKTSEWCEMVNGKDYMMDSALELATVMTVDLTKLNVTSWQYWIAVSCYDYRDGLIYVSTNVHANTHKATDTKRLWAMGNFSRFIDEGYVRVDSKLDDNGLLSVAFKGTDEEGKENLVVVLTNGTENGYELDTSAFAGYNVGEVHLTDKEHSLEKVADINADTKNVEIPASSVVTITLTK